MYYNVFVFKLQAWQDTVGTVERKESTILMYGKCHH